MENSVLKVTNKSNVKDYLARDIELCYRELENTF